jgi:regulation of enolase protein 1 (concanavalin A-like superfamily)
LEAKCKNATIAVQPGGSVDILASHIDDASAGATSYSVSPTTFSCDQLGDQMVTLTVTDDNDDSDNCTAIVTITDGAGLPGGWQASTIGTAPSGSTYNFSACNSSSNDEFSISGSGNNVISSMEDNVAFASQTLCGDGTITAKLEGVDATGYGGLMIRETTDAGAKQTAVFSNISHILRHEVRYTTNGMKQVSSFFKPSPYWLRLERQGDWVYALYSATGSSFQYVHAVHLPMQNCVEIGLASFTFMPTGQATAIFSNVVTTGDIQNITGNNAGTFGAALNDYDILHRYNQAETGVVFPNPARNHFTFQLAAPLVETAMVEVMNLYGQVVAQQYLPAGQVRLEYNTSDWPAGGYLVKMSQTGSTTVVKHIIINK